MDVFSGESIVQLFSVIIGVYALYSGIKGDGGAYKNSYPKMCIRDRYEEALPDLQAICAMPGTKVMIKGNHDFWHASLQKTRQLLENHTYFIQNDAIELGDFVFAGTRGWKQWQEEGFTPQDEKIYRREAGRLRLSLEQAKKTGRKIIGMSHYPPFLANRGPSVFTQCYGEFGVETVIYGHVHGDFTKFHMEPRIRIENTDYFLTSCDFLNFQLKQIL